MAFIGYGSKAWVRLGIGVVAGSAIVYVDNYSFEGEVSPIVIVAMMFAATTAAGAIWGRRGWVASSTAWACVPLAHLLKHVLSLPDTLHPNTYGSILLLAAFTLAVAMIGTGFGILLQRVQVRGDRRSTEAVPLPVRTVTFVIVCASAGALAVPLHAVASPVSAVFAALVGLLGLRVWRWSRLPSSTKTEGLQGAERLVESAVSLALGLMVGLMVLAVIRLAIEPAVPAIGARIAAAGALPVWRRVLVIYVAAVGEELVFRLLLLSLVAGLAARLVRLPDRTPNRVVVWASIGISAFVFASVHLPAWSGAVPLSLGLVLAVLSLNAVGGLVFGYVFATRGIAAAVCAHAGADFAIQFIAPLAR